MILYKGRTLYFYTALLLCFYQRNTRVSALLFPKLRHNRFAAIGKTQDLYSFKHKLNAVKVSPSLKGNGGNNGGTSAAAEALDQKNLNKSIILPVEEGKGEELDDNIMTSDKRDLLIARAAKLRQSIVRQQAELMELEQTIECCTNGNQQQPYVNDFAYIGNKVNSTMYKFISSAKVLTRKLERVQRKVGPNNKKWGSVSEYFLHELASGVRIVSGIVQKPKQIQHLIDPSTPTLIPHVPAIIARLDKLESHVEPILERVLNNKQHLYSVEPYLDEVLERFDDIEPHLPWILDNIDVLAPNTGLLLKHVDALLLFAESNEELFDANDGNDDYSLANQLLPYLEYYVSKLDIIGPHLVLLRPHVPLLVKHNRIGRISPHIDKLFARGYKDLTTSANIDILLFWFGWTLQVPFLPYLFFSLPFSPRLVTFLANRLPKKFARKGKGYCRRLTCTIDDDYGDNWNKLQSRSSNAV